MLMTRLVVLISLLLALVTASPSPAQAADCQTATSVNQYGKVTLRIVCASETLGKRNEPRKRVCMWGTHQVPCVTDMGRWYGPRTCYISLAKPQPPAADPAWQGHTTGALYYCRAAGGAFGTPLLIWIGSADPPPDPETLAREAVRQMQLRPISIGIAPGDEPGSMGLVGMPVWLWAESPGAQTMGPISAAASERGFTVRATAKVEQVRWSMGDGGSEVCSGAGTPYETRFGITESPTCGYRFHKQGTYAVTARSDWVVNWSGIGETGTFRISLSEATQVVIGELNVLTVAEGK